MWSIVGFILEGWKGSWSANKLSNADRSMSSNGSLFCRSSLSGVGVTSVVVGVVGVQAIEVMVEMVRVVVVVGVVEVQVVGSVANEVTAAVVAEVVLGD